MRVRAFLAAGLMLLGGCGNAAPQVAEPVAAAAGPRFPAPERPVADIVSASWSDEASRDREAEAERVMALLKVKPGMAVADIGAGSGYYVMRLSPKVGAGGVVYAQDIMADTLARLGKRVEKAGFQNVTLVLGAEDDAKLPGGAVDLALMVHMYHEIAQPYGLLWNLHGSLKPGARVGIVDADRETRDHGTPPALLKCELGVAGFRQVGFERLGAGSYLAVFEAVGRPEVGGMKACGAGGGAG